MDQSRQRLADSLPVIRKRIQQIRERKDRIGEQNTKAAIIDPVLSALGWDLQDLDEVLREYRRKPQDNPVDYALFLMRTPRLFVEAKPLDADLNDRKWISQTLGYATVVGVEWCVLTNGDEYRIYNSHATVDVEEKLFRSVKISDVNMEDFTLSTLDLLSKDKMGENMLSVLWKAHFIDRHVGAILRNLFNNEDAALVRLIRKEVPELSPMDIRESLRRADIRIDFPASPASSSTLEELSVDTFTPKILESDKSVASSIAVIDLIKAGLIVPPLQLEKMYQGTNVQATVLQDGTVRCNGCSYRSLSVAAGMARNSVIGPPTDGRRFHNTNGWTFWQYRDVMTDELKNIDALRQRFLEQSK